MRVVIVENTDDNLRQLTDNVHLLLPNAIVKGFTNGNDAEKWCCEHSGEIDVYFGNWWGVSEACDTPEGSLVWKYIAWKKKPIVICTGDEALFSSWTLKEGGDSFILRPVTLSKLRDTFEKLDI